MAFDIDSSAFKDLMTVKITQVEMVRDRKYRVSAEELDITQLDVNNPDDRRRFYDTYITHEASEVEESGSGSENESESSGTERIRKLATQSKSSSDFENAFKSFRLGLSRVYEIDESQFDGYPNAKEKLTRLAVYFPVRDKGSKYINKDQLEIIFRSFESSIEKIDITERIGQDCSTEQLASRKTTKSTRSEKSKPKESSIEATSPITWIVIISQVALNADAKKYVSKFTSLHIQLFLDINLSYNPTKHQDYMKHVRMTKKEQEDFLSSTRLKISQLQGLKYVDNISKLADTDKKTDPIVNYLGLLPGQIVWVYRRNFIAEAMIENYTTVRSVVYH